MTDSPDGAGPGGRRPALRLALAAGLALAGLAPCRAAAAELSARGYYLLEPQVVDNLNLNNARRGRRLAFIGQELELTLSFRSGAVDGAIGLELADELAGAQDVREPGSPDDDVTRLQASPDTGTSLVDFFWVRWDMALGVLRAGWFTEDLESYRLFLGRHGAPSVQLEVPLGPLSLRYTFQKVAERTGISTAPASDGTPAVPAPRSTLVGAGDVDAHYLRLELKGQEVGPLEIRRAAAWGVYTADRRPEDAAWLLAVGGLVDVRLGPLALYAEGDWLGGRYDGTVSASLPRGPGIADDETLTSGARLTGNVALFGTALDIGEWLPEVPLVVGTEVVTGSGDRNPADGKAEDTTSLAVVHQNLDDDFELSRLFGAFVLADHAEYFKGVGNLTAVKPFAVAAIGKHLRLGAAAYWLRATRSVAVTLDGATTGEHSRDLGWQYELSARVTLGSGISASVVYEYLSPGPALRPGGSPAQILYASLRFPF